MPSYAWAVVLMLWPVAMLNYLDRQMLAVLRTSIKADVTGLDSDRAYGMAMAAFLWVYAALSPVGGAVADRFSRRRVVVGSLFAWSVVTAATGLARTYEELLLCRALMGVSEAFYIPAALALIADYHSGHTRSRAVGVHQTGIYTGLALGGLAVYVANQSGSWRTPFQAFGAVGVGYAFVLAALLRDSPARPVVAGAPAAGPGEAFRTLGRQAAFWALVAYFTLPAVAGWGIKGWLPAHLHDAFGLSDLEAANWASFTPTAMNVVGAVAGGWAADRAARGAARGRVAVSACGVLLAAVALLALGFADGLPMAVIGVAIFGLGWGVFDANNMPLLCQIARPEHRATGYGVMNAVSIGVGAAATVAMGRWKDSGASFAEAFSLSAGVAIVGAIIILAVPPVRRVTPGMKD